MTGTAIYLNRVTRETYELGFEISSDETALSRAWDLVELVARLQGWCQYDIFVNEAK